MASTIQGTHRRFITVGLMVSPMVNITQAVTVPTRNKVIRTTLPSLAEWEEADVVWNDGQGGGRRSRK
eukprot:14679554-Ditylum_brightwellii.AAC.1